MPDHLRKIAEFSVARGSGFALLAIFVFMVGMSSDMRLSLQVGGILALLACMSLVLMAMTAHRRPYRSTELWILLRPEERPNEAIAQRIICGVLRETYFRFALNFAAGGGALLIMSMILAFAQGGGRTV
jgi:Ca2+/Na+ antiporter